MDRELLIEIGVEELPASWMPDVTRRLAERVEARMIEHRIAPGAPIETFSTPRRLTARIARIAERQEDLDETITGPPVSAATGADGQPTPSALGFARKHGVSFEGLEREDLARHADVWEAAVRKLRTGLMPPLGEPRPARAVLDGFAASLEAGLDAAWARAPNPGARPLARLDAKVPNLENAGVHAR